MFATHRHVYHWVSTNFGLTKKGNATWLSLVAVVVGGGGGGRRGKGGEGGGREGGGEGSVAGTGFVLEWVAWCFGTRTSMRETNKGKVKENERMRNNMKTLKNT